MKLLRHGGGLLCAVVLAVTRFISADDVGDFADGDPIGFLASLAAMPVEEQDVYLDVAGLMLVEEGTTACNIFGGTKECKELPVDSKFAATCSQHRDNLKVDCAYYATSESDLQMDPKTNLETLLGNGKTTQLNDFCPQCFNNVQSLWCAQALPKCGTFKGHVQQALFPAVLEYKKQEDEGQPEQVALAAAVPGLLKAMAKTMACKEMCQAVIRTCSCDEDGIKTLGEILTAAGKNPLMSKSEYSPEKLGLDEMLLKDVWDTPLCDLFVSKDDPEFMGTCDLGVAGSECLDKARYCNDMAEGDKDVVEEMVAMEIAHGVLGFVDGPSGILKQSDAFNKEAKVEEPTPPTPMKFDPVAAPEDTTEVVAGKKEVAAINDKTVQVSASKWEEKRGQKPHPHHHPVRIMGSLFMALLFISLSAIGGIVGWKKYAEWKERRSEYSVLENMHHSPTARGF